MDRPSRRAVLGSLGVGLGSLAGCVNPLRGESSAAGLTVETLDVGGSPGDEIAVAPSGEVALLDFFATWCAPCKPQMDELRTVREEFPDVHVLSITWEDDDEAVTGFWQRHDGTWPVAQDPELRTGQQYEVDNIPTLVLLDADGEEAWRHVGLAAAGTITDEIESARE
jgi:thiol-disulfide isomerase/thioredoxin